VTPISAGRKIKDGPTNKNGPMNKGVATTGLEKVTTHNVQQESIAIQTQIPEL